MLKFFRQKHIAKIVFWALVILILPAFVLWGTGGIGRSKEKGPSYVGLIDRKKISFEDLAENMTGIRSLLVLNYFARPQVLDTFLNNKPLVAKLAWERLICLREARKHKIKIPDKDVIAYIRSHPIFLRNGSFDSRIYGYVLTHNIGLAPRSFEEIVRENLMIQRLKDIIAKDITVSDEEVLKEYKEENEKLKISYILTGTKDFEDKVSMDDKTIKDYYEKHKSEFILPLKEDSDRPKAANFDDVKTSIRSYLVQDQAKALAFKYSEELYKKIMELMEKEHMTFEDATSRLNTKTSMSGFFSKSDYIEGLGEASPLVYAASALAKPGQISSPVRVRSGAVIFKALESKPIDEEKFKKEVDDFKKKVLEEKKLKFLDRWFSEIYLRTNLKIDLEEIEKYYQ